MYSRYSRVKAIKIYGLLLMVTAVFLLILVPFTTQAQTADPTPDRLAAPPTVPAPTQADEGAQLYWLHCQPCHGDKGQGLTDAPDDDWRAQYPPEDQNCWDSGCHGARPYEAGFTIPKQIPAVIGEGSLARFTTLGDVFTFIQVAMPFQWPNSLTEEEYLQITAFLARENGLADGTRFAMADLATIQIDPTYNELLPTSVPTPNLPANDLANRDSAPLLPIWLWFLGGLVVIGLTIGGLLWLRHGR
jgi:cytochrome c5